MCLQLLLLNRRLCWVTLLRHAAGLATTDGALPCHPTRRKRLFRQLPVARTHAAGRDAASRGTTAIRRARVRPVARRASHMP